MYILQGVSLLSFSSKKKKNDKIGLFRYEPPPPDCNGGDGTLSGMTFINFLLSAIAVAANVVSNINSNQRNNNNNNNNNNDNNNNINININNTHTQNNQHKEPTVGATIGGNFWACW